MKCTHWYVVGFFPAADSGNDMSGYDWTPDFKTAVEILKQRISEGEGYNLTLTRVRVPDYLPISTYLENHPKLIKTDTQPDIEEVLED